MHKSEVKFTVKALRPFVSEILASKAVSDFIKKYAKNLVKKDDAALEEQCWQFKQGLYITRDEFVDKVYTQWTNQWLWKCEPKRRLQLGWVNYFVEDADGKYSFIKKLLGKSDKKLVTYYATRRVNPEQPNPSAYKCWLRRYYSLSHFKDIFRLDVVTTPNDREVIGWTIYSCVPRKKRKYTMTLAEQQAVANRGPRGHYKSYNKKKNDIAIVYKTEVIYEREEDERYEDDEDFEDYED